MHRILLGALLLLGLSATAQADMTYVFTDEAICWPGYESDKPTQNIDDTIGQPDILGGTVVFGDTGLLKKITFDYTVIGGKLPDKVRPGDLFLDVNSDRVWDYFVDVSGKNNNYTLYNGPLGVSESTKYKYSASYNWGGSDYRHEHPTEVKTPANFITVKKPGTATNATVALSGYKTTSSTLVFDFANAPLTLAEPDELFLGFTLNCANDVVFTPIPVPGAVWLLGSGLLGLLGLRRRA